MVNDHQTDTLVEMGRKLDRGFDLVTNGLSARYGQPVDAVTVTDRSYSTAEISVDAAVRVNGATEDVTIRAFDGGRQVTYHD